jgi:outer membrane receptor protein involved in Fe transport
MKKIHFLMAFSMIGMQMLAQTTTKDSVQLDEVVVTGSKVEISRKVVPISVSQISKQEIENTGNINVLTTLNTYVPGIFVTQRNVLGFGVSTGGSGGMTLRGIGGAPNTEILVLIDGHPQYQGIFGHPLPDAYVASDVAKVEIIRGPGSFLYGSNAMGGVINIITRKNNKEGISGSVGGAYGMYNTQKYYGAIGYKKNKVSILASANHDYTDGTRANTDFSIMNGLVKAGYAFDEHFNLTIDASVAKFNANDNGPIHKPAAFNIDILRGKASATLENKFDKLQGAFKVYRNFGEHTLSDGFHSTDRNSGAMLYQTYKFVTGTLVTGGVDFKQYGGIVNQTKYKDSLLTVNEIAVYAYAQQNIFEKLTLSAGLRLENNSGYGKELIPMGGISYYPTENTTFKFNASKGFRNPTIMELYLYAPNADLLPERMVNYELSWLQTFMNRRLNIELTTYKVKGNNIIQVVGQYPNTKRQNVGSFDNQGVEFSARLKVDKNIMLNANYSYLDLSTAVLAAPRQQLNLGIHLTHQIWNVSMNAQYIERLYTSVVPQIVQGDYLLLNARISCTPIKNLQLFIVENNILNQTYQINYGYPMPGFNFHGGINYNF